MTLAITFRHGTFERCSDALKFAFPYINFQIISISSKASQFHLDTFNLEKGLSALDENNDFFFRILNTADMHDESKKSLFFRKDKLHDADIFYFEIESLSDLKMDEFLKKAMEYNFSTCCFYDSKKARWQSEEIVDKYEKANRSFGKLRRYDLPNLPPWHSRRVDIFENPGHYKLTFQMILMAAPQMWFGPNSLQYFDRNKLLSFPNAIETQALSDNLIYVKLFDILEQDYESPKILNLQKYFREWVDMDKIELQLNGLIPKQSEN